MSNDTIESATPAPEAESPNGKRKAGKKTKATKKQAAAKKAAGKPIPDRSNKKGVVIELLKRAKGTMLAEILKATTGSTNDTP